VTPGHCPADADPYGCRKGRVLVTHRANIPLHAAPTRVRRGYALSSIATGTFGTVPGLLLLPYLTDTLGVAAVVAG
jgi:hypothetical protein